MSHYTRFLKAGQLVVVRNPGFKPTPRYTWETVIRANDKEVVTDKYRYTPGGVLFGEENQRYGRCLMVTMTVDEAKEANQKLAELKVREDIYRRLMAAMGDHSGDRFSNLGIETLVRIVEQLEGKDEKEGEQAVPERFQPGDLIKVPMQCIVISVDDTERLMPYRVRLWDHKSDDLALDPSEWQHAEYLGTAWADDGEVTP